MNLNRESRASVNLLRIKAVSTQNTHRLQKKQNLKFTLINTLHPKHIFYLKTTSYQISCNTLYIIYLYGRRHNSIYLWSNIRTFFSRTHKNQLDRWEFWVEDSDWLYNSFRTMEQFRRLSKLKKHIKRTLFVNSTTLI